MISDTLLGKTKKDTISQLNELSTNDKVLTIIKMGLDFSLIERDDNGVLIFNGDMILDKKNLTKLPNNMKIHGDLWCSFNPLLTSLPKGLYVDGKLDCYDSSIVKLPDNLYIGGDFDCSNNLIERLPKGLSVNGDFRCSSNLISEIPSDIYITGDLHCSHNGLVKIQKGANIVGVIDGDNWIQK